MLAVLLEPDEDEELLTEGLLCEEVELLEPPEECLA